MGKIIFLDENTTNQIAAGEVVERPASIVKELVENSLDAKAGQIFVDIQKGGISRISVSDDGEGLERDDMAVAFERYSTSKIRRAEDILRISSFGFRGEALASIASVSKVVMSSKTKGSQTGSQIRIEGGKTIDINTTSCNYGTTIIIQDLFYNVPARFKFLKNDSTEASHINDILSKLAVANPGISFTYTSNDRAVFKTPGNDDLKSAIYSIFGKDIADNLIKVDYAFDNYKLTGYITAPSYYKKNRDHQLVFLNRRYIRSKIFTYAIDKAFEAHQVRGRYPAVFLNMTVDPSLTDINVHPQKLEARFSDERDVYNMICHGIMDALDKKPVFFENSVSFSKPVPVKEAPLTFTQALIKEDVVKTDISSVLKQEPALTPVKDKADTVLDRSKKTFSELVNESVYKGQLFNTYLMFEKTQLLLLIDQHAAHERINYEKILQMRKQGVNLTQSLLEPVTLALSNSEMITYSQNTDFITELGYDTQEFGENAILIRGIPTDKDQSSIIDTFMDILENLRKQNYDITDENIAMIACKSSIKGNHKLDPAHAAALISRLSETDNPLNCPHGRTIVQVIQKKELEKLFQRRL